MSKCKWIFDDDEGKYDTGCGNAIFFIEGDVAYNGYCFCPKCGNAILEVEPPVFNPTTMEEDDEAEMRRNSHE